MAAKFGEQGGEGAALTISPGAPVMPCCPRAPTSPCEWRRRHSGTGPCAPQGCGMDGGVGGAKAEGSAPHPPCPLGHLYFLAGPANPAGTELGQTPRVVQEAAPCHGVTSAVGLFALILTACPRCPGGPGRPGCPAEPCMEKVQVRRTEKGTGRRTLHVSSSPSHPGCPACRPCHQCQADPAEGESSQG